MCVRLDLRNILPTFKPNAKKRRNSQFTNLSGVTMALIIGDGGGGGLCIIRTNFLGFLRACGL